MSEHPPRITKRARELHVAGWSVAETRKHLNREFGLNLPRSTVAAWVDLEYADRRRESKRATQARARAARGWEFRLSGRHHSREYREAFMRECKRAGLTVNSIVKIYGVVFDDTTNYAAVKAVVSGVGK